MLVYNNLSFYVFYNTLLSCTPA